MMRYQAHCPTCGTTVRFPNYDERGDWVGKHRVRTGHKVEVSEVES